MVWVVNAVNFTKNFKLKEIVGIKMAETLQMHSTLYNTFSYKLKDNEERLKRKLHEINMLRWDKESEVVKRERQNLVKEAFLRNPNPLVEQIISIWI